MLIVAPDHSSLRRVLRRLSGKPFSWDYLGQDLTTFRLLSESFEGQGSRIDTSHSFHEAAQSLREPYLAYLYDIGRNLNSLRWWITSLAHRSTYVVKTFHQACYLKVAIELAESWEGAGLLVVVVADEPVRRAIESNLTGHKGGKVQVIGPRRALPLRWPREAIRMSAHRAFFLFKGARRLVQSRLTVGQFQIPTAPTILVLSTAHSGNAGQGEEFHRASFGDLVSKLEGFGHRVAVVPLVLWDLPYGEALRRIRGTSRPQLVPSRLLTFRDLAGAMLSSLTMPPLISPIPTFAGMDISPLVKEEMWTHWVSNQAADALLIVAMVRRWAALGTCVTRIIYKYENQPWERALCWAASRYLPEARLVGYQHARVPRLLLSFHLAPGEEKDAPLPHRVVTSGKHAAKIFTDGGYTSGRVRVGGALLAPELVAQRLLDNEAPIPTTGAGPPTVLVTCAFGREEAAELADLARQLFDASEGVHVVLKCHRAMTFGMISHLMSGPLPSHIEISEEPITDLMIRSSVMVYTGTMACVEALAIGLPVVHLRPKFELDMDPLEEMPETRLEAEGLEELREKVRWVLENRDRYIADHQESWARAVGEQYGPVTEETFRAFVD